MHVVSAEAATPQAKAFIDSLLASLLFDVENCSITSRELRAIISAEPIDGLTRPMIEPAMNVVEDLWQLNHVTASYIGRATAGSLLLAYGSYMIVQLTLLWRPCSCRSCLRYWRLALAFGAVIMG